MALGGVCTYRAVGAITETNQERSHQRRLAFTPGRVDTRLRGERWLRGGWNCAGGTCLAAKKAARSRERLTYTRGGHWVDVIPGGIIQLSLLASRLIVNRETDLSYEIYVSSNKDSLFYGGVISKAG
ncbi:hypothetical protein PUN28_017556 [Cardiocondyla obscurior]|uniref:Uncharacterized protein n=1 Tax=Cardiocondyla obscurior TaxID=286306 RepID=A0AAW2EI05_9HYME